MGGSNERGKEKKRLRKRGTRFVVLLLRKGSWISRDLSIASNRRFQVACALKNPSGRQPEDYDVTENTTLKFKSQQDLRKSLSNILV